MNSELKEYLLHEWKWNNHVKYLKYFEDWVGNLTEQQIQWYQAYKEGGEDTMVEEIVNIVKEWLVDCSPGFLYRFGKDLTLDSDYNGLREKLKEFYDSR